MLGSSGFGRPRTRGSWIPRLTGVGIVVLLAGGGALWYSGSHPSSAAHRQRPARHQQVTLSTKVVQVQTVGLIAFGPYDDRDPAVNDHDDHPLMLSYTRSGLMFVPVSEAQITSGTPQWTVDQMADGTDIFIYVPSGQCLQVVRAIGSAGERFSLAHCDLRSAQRWRSVSAAFVGGDSIVALTSVADGACLTAPRRAGPALLSACGPARTKDQEMAFWWTG